MMPKVANNTLTTADVHAIGEKLDQLEEKPRLLSTREIINLLKPKVAALRQKGYSFDEIATELTKNGIKITGSSLKAYAGTKNRKRKPAERTSTPSARETVSEQKRPTQNTDSN